MMSTETPFHEHELAIQRSLGLQETLHRQVSSFIRPNMPQQHQDFYKRLPFVLIAALDSKGFPWLSPIFANTAHELVEAIDESTIRLAGKPMLSETVDLSLNPGDKLGMLGIELETRRRNRVNGSVAKLDAQGLTLRVEQSFGNCPQYIQKREINWINEEPLRTLKIKPSREDGLTPDAALLLEKTDTFFIASRVKDVSGDPRQGLDASHRGGTPGFVKVEGNTMTFPDFSGNRFFNTIGNIQSDNRVGIFVPNFSNGDACFVVGKATVIWDKNMLHQYPDAERFIKIDVISTVFMSQTMPMRAKLLHMSPSLSPSQAWVQKAQPQSSKSFAELYNDGFQYVLSR